MNIWVFRLVNSLIIPLPIIAFLVLLFFWIRNTRKRMQESTIRELEQMLCAKAEIVQRGVYIYSFRIAGMYKGRKVIVKVNYGINPYAEGDKKVPSIDVFVKLTDEQIQKYGKGLIRLKFLAIIKNILKRIPVFIIENGFVNIYKGILFGRVRLKAIVKDIEDAVKISESNFDKMADLIQEE